MADRKYCYPNSNVLINKLNIRDSDKLHDFEHRLTMLRLSELLDKPIVGKFDFDHLQRIHRYPNIQKGFRNNLRLRLDQQKEHKNQQITEESTS
ncbi:MAG: hypothetical protein LUH55_03860 [Bacteroides thetaiotaomicron]|nr:hypothetical protein [Bacteroides thetaiotaomicron]